MDALRVFGPSLRQFARTVIVYEFTRSILVGGFRAAHVADPAIVVILDVVAMLITGSLEDQDRRRPALIGTAVILAEAARMAITYPAVTRWIHT